jgi:L-cysteine desulfidase
VAAVAIVYQQKGNHMGKITFAVNNLISDLGGMLNDGAKAGCVLKVVSSADSAIRSSYMALNNHGITGAEGFVGKTPEETMWNLSKISAIGMAKVDDTMLAIMKRKTL